MTGLLPILLAAWMGALGAHDQENPLYRQLVTTGVSVGGKSLAVLPKPTMPDGASAADEQAALKSIPMRVPLDQFTRDSLVAPFAMVIGPLTETESGVRLRALDLWFVVHGSLKAIQENRELLESFLRQAEGKAHELTKEQLAERRIETPPAAAERTNFTHAESTLLDRVRLSVTTHTVHSHNDQSTVFAGEIDQRFAADAAFPNQWRAVEITPQGGKVGLPEPYQLSASYWKATQLSQPARAILIEYHSVFEQPVGWFGGRDLLRSKMPMAVQNEVRTFRRKLKKATE